VAFGHSYFSYLELTLDEMAFGHLLISVERSSTITTRVIQLESFKGSTRVGWMIELKYVAADGFPLK